jgi:hypothetical protein
MQSQDLLAVLREQSEDYVDIYTTVQSQDLLTFLIKRAEQGMC